MNVIGMIVCCWNSTWFLCLEMLSWFVDDSGVKRIFGANDKSVVEEHEVETRAEVGAYEVFRRKCCFSQHQTVSFI